MVGQPVSPSRYFSKSFYLQWLEVVHKEKIYRSFAPRGGGSPEINFFS